MQYLQLRHSFGMNKGTGGIVMKFFIDTANVEGIRKTNVTLIFSANQALLAAEAGASYVSPFLGRLDDKSPSYSTGNREVHS